MARSPQSQQVARTILPTSVSPLRFPVTKGESDDYADALGGAIAAAAKVLAAEVKSGAVIPDDFAGRYLRENSLSKLTGNFSTESVKQLQNAIADAWQAGGSYDQVVQAVQDTFEQFSSVRAGMIAQTEINGAYVAGRDAMAHQLGYEQKRWSADGTECCDECQEQIDAGWIGLDDDFPIGDDPPGHVSCDCSVDYRQGYGDEE